MKEQNIPEIDILDCEIHTPYRSAIVQSCARIDKNKYLLVTSLLDSVYVDRLYLNGDKIVYKLKKVVEDGKCKTTIVK